MASSISRYLGAMAVLVIFNTPILVAINTSPKSPAAYLLARARQSGGWISIAILLSRMAPPIAFAIPYFLAYRYVGLLDTVLGLAIII